MILVDDQSGSSALYPFIKSLCPDTILTRVSPPFGDIVWIGDGPDGPVDVGVEYKKLDDVMDCMISGRFSGHQLIGLIEHYPRRYLLVEYGQVRADRNSGVLQRRYGDRWSDITRKGRGFTYRELEHWYTTIEEQTQTRVVKTFDEYESARWVQMKHSWWTNKGWAEHDALNQFHIAQAPSVQLVKPGLVRRVAKELPHLGWDKSIAVEAEFRSVLDMAMADQTRWERIAGIGRTIAVRVVRAIRGEN